MVDIHAVKIMKRDVDRVIATAIPAQPASFTGDACEVYRSIRPLLETAIGLLKLWYPQAHIALATAVAILDKVCETPSSAS